MLRQARFQAQKPCCSLLHSSEPLRCGIAPPFYTHTKALSTHTVHYKHPLPGIFSSFLFYHVRFGRVEGIILTQPASNMQAICKQASLTSSPGDYHTCLKPPSDFRRSSSAIKRVSWRYSARPGTYDVTTESSVLPNYTHHLARNAIDR